jgi:hypothetical protein
MAHWHSRRNSKWACDPRKTEEKHAGLASQIARIPRAIIFIEDANECGVERRSRRSYRDAC